MEAFIGSTRSLCYGYRQRPCGLTRRHGRGVGSYSVSDRSQLPLIPQWDKRLPSGAGSTSMGLAERFFRVAKANLNAILKVSDWVGIFCLTDNTCVLLLMGIIFTLPFTVSYYIVCVASSASFTMHY